MASESVVISSQNKATYSVRYESVINTYLLRTLYNFNKVIKNFLMNYSLFQDSPFSSLVQDVDPRFLGSAFLQNSYAYRSPAQFYAKSLLQQSVPSILVTHRLPLASIRNVPLGIRDIPVKYPPLWSSSPQLLPIQTSIR